MVDPFTSRPHHQPDPRSETESTPRRRSRSGSSPVASPGRPVHAALVWARGAVVSRPPATVVCTALAVMAAACERRVTSHRGFTTAEPGVVEAHRGAARCWLARDHGRSIHGPATPPARPEKVKPDPPRADARGLDLPVASPGRPVHAAMVWARGAVVSHPSATVVCTAPAVMAAARERRVTCRREVARSEPFVVEAYRGAAAS